MTRSFIFLMVFVVATLLNCEPTPSAEELNKDLLVQTDIDSTIDFGSYTTYTQPIDTLGLISNSISDTLILGEYAKRVSAEIKLNMDSRGFVYVDKNQSPDLGINAFIVNDFNVFQSISYPSYYGGGYYSPYYGYYYPVVNTYALNSAILIIQLVDFKKVNAQNQFQLIWTCYIGDVIASPDPVQKSVEAVTQAFIQTPLLRK